ncbi:DUF6270 domain-containing protein [Vreelandella aquamarina]
MRFGILGSCVTRDIFTHSKAASEWSVSTYLSRATCQSILSDKVGFSFKELPAASFSDRRFRNDFNKEHFSLIKADRELSDFFLLDFIDERHSVYFDGENYLTKTKSSKPYIRKLIRSVGGEVVAPGDKKWSEKEVIESIVKLVKKIIEIRGEVFIHRAYWAEKYKDDTGEVFLFNNDVLDKCLFWNSLLYKVYCFLEKIDGVFFFDITEEPVANKNHKWGCAPFHYENSYYIKASEEIFKLACK